MMRIRNAGITLRTLLCTLLTFATVIGPAGVPAAVLAAPLGAPAEAPASTYLDQLLGEINARRAMAGTPPITYVTREANDAVSQYLADLTPLMQAYHTCFHGTGDPVPPAWDYVAAAGLDGEPRGEVLGCPGEGFYWSAQAITDGWWRSPSHFHSLYADPEANAVACGTYGPRRDGQAFVTIACVTYQI